MPYSIGAKGSYGCSGYPVVKDSDKEVMGCHETREAAARQIAAIESNENKAEEKRETDRNGMGSKIGQPHPASKKPSLFRKPNRKRPTTRGGSVPGPGGAISSSAAKSERTWDQPQPITETSGFKDEVETRNRIDHEIGNESNPFFGFGKDYTKSQRLNIVFRED